MLLEENYLNERLDHLGIVAGVCQEIGLASWLDAQEPEKRKPGECGNSDSSDGSQWVRVEPPTVVSGTAVLCEQTRRTLGFDQASRQRCKSVDCLGRTLDWLYAHDLTQLFAGIASRARQIFGITAKQVHVDTTSFSVSGEYARAEGEDARVIAITYGYSRDHREDLKQWMLARASTHEGEIPLFMQPLDGTSLDKVSLLAAIETIHRQFREAGGEASGYVADNGVGSRDYYHAVEPSRSQVGESRL